MDTEELSIDPVGESLYTQITEQSERPAEWALMMLRQTIEGTARLRADAAYLCGKPDGYRPDWDQEMEVVAGELDKIGIDPKPALIEKWVGAYKEPWIERFECVHSGDHFSLILEDPIMEIPDRARP